MTIYNFDATVKTIEGADALNENKEPVTLRSLIANALQIELQDSQKLSFEDKESRYKLACKIFAGGDIDLSNTEVNLIRNVSGKFLSVSACGQIAIALDRQ